uniref:Uncharacterized protein n=1 Tax=Strongyloides stercoralis TaxID=6248 RepID=A0AAF5DQC9_STRER
MVENEIHETDNNANVNNESGNDNITDLEKNVDDNLIDLEQSSGNYSTDMDNPTERNIIETLNENLDNKKEFSTTENIPQNESSVIESQDRSQQSNSTISIRKIIPSRNMEQNKIDKFLNTSIKYDKFEVEDNLIIGSYDASKYNIDIKINTDKDVFITFKKIKQTEMISRNDSITSSLSIIQQNEESLPKKNLLESSLFKNLKCAVNYVESTRMYSYIIIKPEWNNHKDYNIMLHDKYDNNEDIKIICIIKYLERINDKYFSFILDIKKNINFSSRRKKVSEHRIVRYIYEATRMVLLHCYRIDNNWIKVRLLSKEIIKIFSDIFNFEESSVNLGCFIISVKLFNKSFYLILFNLFISN